MTMTDAIILLVLIVIVGGAIAYIYKAKKSGAKCIGCPESKSCSSGCSECHCNDKK